MAPPSPAVTGQTIPGPPPLDLPNTPPELPPLEPDSHPPGVIDPLPGEPHPVQDPPQVPITDALPEAV